jgi:hypothetical protein
MDVRQQAGLAPDGTLALGGRTFVCRPPKNSDFAALQKEMRKRIQERMADPVDAVNRRISEAERQNRPLSPTVARLMVQEAMAADSARAKIEPTDGQLLEEAKQPDSVRWFVWWLVRKADPSVTLDQVREWLPDDDSAIEMNDQITALANTGGLHPN